MTRNVRYSNSVGIKVHVATNSNHNTVLRVSRSDCSYSKDPAKLTLSWDHDLNRSDNAVKAVEWYLARRDETDGWDGEWVIAGAGDSDWVAVKAGN